MTLAICGTILFAWVTKYLALACVASILCWIGGSWFIIKKESLARDCGIYFVTIGILALVLLIRPANTTSLIWNGITWFSFAMLMIMELLWLSYVIENLVKLLTKPFSGVKHPQKPASLKAHPVVRR